MLEEIVAEMKKNALANQLDVKNGKYPDQEKSVKRVAIGDVLCHLMFTCDLFPGDKKIWHLSLSTIPYGPVPEETADQLRKAFFGEAQSFEMPSFLHGNRMKQYVSRVQ